MFYFDICSFEVYLYTHPSTFLSQQLSALLVGLLLLLTTLPLAYFLEKRAKFLFAPKPLSRNSSLNSGSSDNSSSIALGSSGVLNVNYPYESMGATGVESSPSGGVRGRHERRVEERVEGATRGRGRDDINVVA